MTAPAAHTDRKRRARRIAADEAHSWARNLRLGNPYAKLVLSMLTIYVNGEGSCFVSIAALAEDCELAFETVRKRLAWLESVGAITRFPQWIDEHGRRNSDGKGRRTTDDIRLMIHSDPDEIEAKANGNGDDLDPPSQEGANQEAPPAPEEGTDSIGSPVAPPLAPPPQGGTISNHEPESEETPLPPKGGEAAAVDEFDQAKEASWLRFQEAWQEPILRQSIARQIWWAFKEDEELLATKAAQGYVVWRSRQKKPPNVINAHTFLREREAWPKFAELAPIERRSSEKITVLPGSEAWRGVAVVKRIWKSEEPQGAVEVGADNVAALKSLSALYDLTEHEWADVFDKRDHKQASAWKERLYACGFKMPDAERVFTGETHPTLGEVWHAGWLLPCPWPPRMDGTLCTTGPPTSPTMTEDDVRELEKFK